MCSRADITVMNPDERSVVAAFARAPVLGRVKTRLAQTVGDDAALRIHRELLDRTLRILANLEGLDAELWVDGPTVQFAGLGLSIRAQGDGDLGERMLAVIADITRRGRSAIIVGSDCPVLDADYIRAADKALMEGCDAVLGPVEDGGYILIGMSRPIPELMTDMVWSTPTVYAETLARAAALGLNVVSLRTLWDIDNAADLDRWRRMSA
jgi:rSAM/selenodomain-associated transferase 1